jgi:hypothetical protein
VIIKSHIRGGYRDAAAYLKAQGENEKVRLVEISDFDARNLDEAFRNMWTVASNTKATKPLHHISINPFRDERLTDAQVLKIVARCEEKYGYKPGDHQRVIVEHVKDGRQHFHVMWNRVSLVTGKAVWPGHHWNKSKQAAREMEKELGLKRPTPKRSQGKRAFTTRAGVGRVVGYRTLKPVKPFLPHIRKSARHERPAEQPQQPARSQPTPFGGMSAEQLADFIAACEGRITWRQYFERWGKKGLSF